MVSGRWQEDYPKPEGKKDRSLVINQTNPDVLAIQEIGERVYLDELWQDLNIQTEYSLNIVHGYLDLGEAKAFGSVIKNSFYSG